ncbi:MAG: SIS domain-containing protein [Candidatus Omnitrophica bacterium]|nr:SIS domain-containing protein [Candidatus Omnitrophota bacterium]
MKLFDEVQATDQKGVDLDLDEALEQAIQIIENQHRADGKLIFIGNGGSAAIASHMAVDFWKNGGVKAITFNDAALLTCLSNDCGYSQVFEKSIEMFGEEEDVLIAISSSGQSENILRGAEMALTKGVKLITLSGFDAKNPLRQKGAINFYVPVAHYGQVEVLHHALCHCIIDHFLANRKDSAK